MKFYYNKQLNWWGCTYPKDKDYVLVFLKDKTTSKTLTELSVIKSSENWEEKDVTEVDEGVWLKRPYVVRSTPRQREKTENTPYAQVAKVKSALEKKCEERGHTFEEKDGYDVQNGYTQSTIETTIGGEECGCISYTILRNEDYLGSMLNHYRELTETYDKHYKGIPKDLETKKDFEVLEYEYNDLTFRFQEQGFLKGMYKSDPKFVIKWVTDTPPQDFKDRTIKKVKRLSDGEVFSVGDIVKFFPLDRLCIFGFAIYDNPNKVYALYGTETEIGQSVIENISKVEESTPAKEKEQKNKEFSVLEYEYNHDYYVLQTNGRYKAAISCGGRYGQWYDPNVPKDFKDRTITKVRRESDGEIFSVGDTVKNCRGGLQVIVSFSYHPEGGCDVLYQCKSGSDTNTSYFFYELDFIHYTLYDAAKAYKVNDGWVCEGDEVWVESIYGVFKTTFKKWHSETTGAVINKNKPF